MELSKAADLIRKVKNTVCSVVVVAAGSSTRMGKDKLFLDLEGMPVLVRTLRVFDECSFVREVILVAREDMAEDAAELCRAYGIRKVARVVIGGATRTESVLAGISSIDREARIVLVHDGARPLVTEDIIYDAMHKAAIYSAAAPAVPVTDTIKETQRDIVVRTPDRASLAAVQTPQAFVPEILKAALTAAVRDGKEYTDDCAAVEAMGVRVHLSKGSRENIKITGPLDMELAAGILRSRHE